LARQNSLNPALPLLHLEHARAPYAIELSTEMVRRLVAVVKSGEVSGCEVGGLLIGSFPQASILTLRVEDFVALERRTDDESRFELSIEQRARLSTMRHRLLQQHRVLGIFRSDLRKDKLVLSNADRELIAAEFGRAIHVGLLICAEPPYPSAFFLPDAEGALQAAPRFPEFQFNAGEIARLAPRSTGIIPSPVETPAAISTDRRGIGLWLTTAWLVVSLLLCLSLTLWAPLTARMLLGRGGLRLTVEPREGMLELQWNRNQPDLSRASSAVLSIEEGAVSHRLALTPAQIREGRIAYKSAGDRVTFRMHVPLSDSTELVQTVAASSSR
jgi:hypothetical protein